MRCHHVEFKDKGIKVWAFDPGYVVTNLSETGEKGRQERVRNGTGDANVSAKGLLGIVEGKRDSDAGRHLNGDGVVP
jgi:short-subunit dehydrogenase